MFDDLSGFDGFKPVEHDRDDFDTGLIMFFFVNNMKINIFTTFTDSVHVCFGFLSFTNRIRRLKRF